MRVVVENESSEFWKSWAKIMKIFAPESRTKGVKSQRKGNVLGYRSASTPDFERKSRKPLTTGFMIYGLFIFLKSRD